MDGRTGPEIELIPGRLEDRREEGEHVRLLLPGHELRRHRRAAVVDLRLRDGEA